MTDENTPAAEQPSGNVTLDVVRAALGDADPFQTNASKLRAVIGRGSTTTVQKYLEEIRDERIAAMQPAASEAAPRPPADVVDAIWTAAWTAAQTKTLLRLEKLSAERDGLALKSEAQVSDLMAANTRIEELDAEIEQARTDLTAAQEQAASDVQAAQAAAQANIDALTALQAEFEKFRLEAAHAAETAAQDKAAALAQMQVAYDKLKSDSDHAAELAKRDLENQRLAMQSTIDHLNNQVSEMKAMRIVAAAPAPALTATGGGTAGAGEGPA